MYVRGTSVFSENQYQFHFKQGQYGVEKNLLSFENFVYMVYNFLMKIVLYLQKNLV